MPEVNFARIRFDSILAYFYYGKCGGVHLGSVRCAVLCYGLPGPPPAHYHPLVERLVDKGFLVACPEYPGTFGSYGKCDFENAAEAAVKTVGVLQRGSAVKLSNLKKLRWKAREIILIGASFGGGVALVAGVKSNAVEKIIALAPVTDYRKLTPKRRPYIERGFANLWRVEGGAWNKLVRGKLDINPIDHVQELVGKHVFLIHGDRDNVVSISHSKRLLKALRKLNGTCELFVIQGEGHPIIGSMTSSKAVQQIMDFLA